MTVFQKGAFKAEILLRLHIKKASKTYFLYLIGVLKTLLLLMSNFAVPSLWSEMSFSQSFDNLSVDPEGYVSEKSDLVGKC